MFNPSDFDYYGLYVPESFAYFIPPSIGNNPSPDQRMIIIAGADSMVIDFHNIPKTTRYELTILQQIYFMPGYYSLDCSLPARDLKINENEREILYAAVKHYRDWETDRKSTRLNSSHSAKSRMPSSA